MEPFGVEAEVYLEKKFEGKSGCEEERKVKKMFEFWGRQKRHSTEQEKFEHPYDFEWPEMPTHAGMDTIPEETE